MSSTPVLRMPDFSKKFTVETDASHTGIGAVLMQEGQPIAYFSKALAPRKLGLSNYEKELFAVVSAVQKWRGYLLGRPFVIKTDQQAIQFLLGQKISTPEQQKWLTKLLGFDYSIEYKRGKENVVADPLSRLHDSPSLHQYNTGQSNAISSVIPQWKLDIRNSLEGDADITTILNQLAINPSLVSEFSLIDGDLRRNGRLCVGNNGNLRHDILQNLHNSREGGHSGINATIKRVSSIFWWPHMTKDITTWVSECEVCQRFKNEHVKYPGLLEPIAVPVNTWEVATMDFIESLPKSNGKDTILVMIDKYTKYCHLMALQHPFTATQVAQLVLDTVVKLYGPLSH